MDEAPVFEGLRTKVQQQPGLDAGGFQIVEDLSLLVDSLQEATPQFTVDFHRCPNDGIRA